MLTASASMAFLRDYEISALQLLAPGSWARADHRVRLWYRPRPAKNLSAWRRMAAHDDGRAAPNRGQTVRRDHPRRRRIAKRVESGPAPFHRRVDQRAVRRPRGRSENVFSTVSPGSIQNRLNALGKPSPRSALPKSPRFATTFATRPPPRLPLLTPLVSSPSSAISPRADFIPHPRA